MQRGAQSVRRSLGMTSAGVGSNKCQNTYILNGWSILGRPILGTNLDHENAKSVPMQRGARSEFGRSAPMQRGARFLIFHDCFGARCWAQ